MSGFIITSETTIDAIGATEAEAWADLRATLRTRGVTLVEAEADIPTDAYGDRDPVYVAESAYTCHEATDALVAEIEARGGCLHWTTLADGTACTRDERDAEREAQETAAEARAESVAEILAAQTIPAACAEWADSRREMLRAMAAAHITGNPRVAVSKRGLLQWTAAAPLRHETAPNEPRPCPLSLNEHGAAEEMSHNLCEPKWLREIALRADRRRQRERLEHVGRALYGPEWISPLARALDVALRTVQRWAAGEIETPDWTAEALDALARGPVGTQRLADLTNQMRALENLRTQKDERLV